MSILKPEIKTAWLTALRSGEYAQGTLALHKNNKFCCLGVLCDVAVKAGLPLKVEAYSGDESLICYDGVDSYLPARVFDWARVGPENGFFDTHVLANMNDIGESFDTIAYYIEKFY